MVIIYLSSGITTRESSEQEKRATLSVVREENRHLNNSVMILTYALMNGSSLVIKTKPFVFVCLRPHYPQCNFAIEGHHWRQYIKLKAASSGATKGFTPRPVHTLYCVKLVESPFK